MKRSAVLLLTILFAACGGAASPSASPSAEAALASSAPSLAPSRAPTSRTPSPSPTATPSPPVSAPPQAVVLKVDSIAQVVTSDLVVRSAPGVGTDSKQLEPLLQKPARVFVVDGPVAKDGYDWYQVQPVTNDAPFGWVAAASREGEPWLRHAITQCPSLPLDISALGSLRPFFGLACYKSKSLTVDARLGKPEATCGVSPGWTIDPGWLGPCVAHDFLTVLDGDTADPSFDAVFAPKVDLTRLPKYGIEPRAWLKVRFTGQFDHPAARTCRGVKEDTDPPSPPEIVLECRIIFVITAIRAVP